MLNRHPRIACGPEGKLLKRTSFRELHGDLESRWLPRMATKYGIGAAELDHAMAAFIDNFFTRYQLRQGKQRWAEKTPGNIFHIDYLFRLFPRAQFLHMLRDADTDGPLGSIKLRARFEQIERRPDDRRAGGRPGRLIIAAPHPGSETFAANGPSFSVAICYEIGECDPAGGMKYLLTERHLLEHIGRP